MAFNLNVEERNACAAWKADETITRFSVKAILKTRSAAITFVTCAVAGLTACGGGIEGLGSINDAADANFEASKSAEMVSGAAPSAATTPPTPSAQVARADAPAAELRKSNPAPLSPVASSAANKPWPPSDSLAAPAVARDDYPVLLQTGVAPANRTVATGNASAIQATPSVPFGQPLPMSPAEFQMVSMPFGTAHEAIPVGVPPGYDWRLASKLHAANRIPAGYKAFTGWAQVFSATGSDPTKHPSVEIRNHQTLMCTRENGLAVWRRVQAGGITGAVFRPDFAGNVNSPATTVETAPETLRVSFPVNQAYHFWPRQGRMDLPTAPLCGHVVLLEARAVKPNGEALSPGDGPGLLIGVGADYWLSRSAPYDNHLTNVPSAAGHLRLVTARWQWFGMSVAEPAELAALQINGFRLGIAS